MKKMFKLTKEGIEELQRERDGLIAERAAITERIQTARELGDLSENAEYASAKSEQERSETRIAEIEHILKNVEEIKTPKSNHMVRLGSYVKLKGEGGKTKEYQVVGTVEADPLEGKISDESPIGKALIGHKLGDKVEIILPNETSEYIIAQID